MMFCTQVVHEPSTHASIESAAAAPGQARVAGTTSAVAVEDAIPPLQANAAASVQSAEPRPSAPASMESAAAAAAAAPSQASAVGVQTGVTRSSADLELPESIEQLLEDMREFVRTQREKRLSQSRARGSTESAPSATN